MTVNAKNKVFEPPKVAAAILGVHTSTLRNWAVAGKIEVMITPGRRYRYDVTGFLERAGQATAAKLERDAKKAAARDLVKQEKAAVEKREKLDARRKMAQEQAAAQPQPQPAE